LSCLVTLALRHAGAHPSPVSLTHGYVLSFRIATVLLAIGGVLVLFLLEHVLAQPRNPQAESIAAPEAVAS
jgi:hypothetical protein